MVYDMLVSLKNRPHVRKRLRSQSKWYHDGLHAHDHTEETKEIMRWLRKYRRKTLALGVQPFILALSFKEEKDEEAASCVTSTGTTY